MQLGFVSAILPDLDLREVMEFAARTGYDCVEVMCWPQGKDNRRYAGVTHINVAALTDAKIHEIRELQVTTGVSISGLGYYPNPLAADPLEAQVYIDHIYLVIDAAIALGLKHVNTFIGRNPSLSVEENWPRFLEVWTPLVRYAEAREVYIGIENCPMSFGRDEWPGGKNLATSPAIWEQMWQAINSPYFGLNYDPSHLVLQFMDYTLPIRNYPDKIFHVHAKDMRIDQDKLDRHGVFSYPHYWHTPKIPGLGAIDWGRFFSYLTDSGYQGAVCVEVEDRAFEKSLLLRKRSLELSVRYLRQFV
ncbi:MAG: sugar phosphate isomerase/epimerase [Lewinellaceae bacterium]|nr:sugar phosphate isomerase/epimerase [Lewinellaceae bacterium]HPR00087.1 sugar phosphate isomerase/epimerase family protein [Saprospiraceae bacterium]